MLRILFTLFLIPFSLFITQAQTFESVWQFGSEESSQEVTDWHRDAAGNFYITGNYTGTVDLGGHLLTSTGAQDVFVLKTDADFNVLWAISGGGGAIDQSAGLTLDEDGNCYVGGTFEGTATFGSFSNNSLGYMDIFVIKIDINSNIIWFQHGGSNSDYANTDLLKEIHFNKSTTTIDIISSSNSGCTFGTFTSSSKYVKVKYSLTGSVSGLQNINIDALSSFIINTAKINKDNKAFITTKVTSSGTQLIACAKLDLNGAVEYMMESNSIDASTDTWNVETHKVYTENYPFVYFVGTFYKTLIWNSKSVINTGQDNTNDLFLTKLNLEEDSVYWMKRIGGNGDERVYSIDSDADKNLYVSGYYENTCDFGSGVTLNTADRAGFAAKYDSLGNLQWAKSVGNGTGDRVNEIFVEDDGTAYIAGKFFGTAVFDDTTLTCIGSSDIFFAKLGCAPAKPSGITGDTLLCVGSFDYSVLNTPSVTYNWSISGGGTLTENGNQAQIDWDTPGTHTLTVRAENACGLGVPQSIPVRVKTLPEDLSLSGDTLACLGTEAYNVDFESETAYDWHINGGGMLFGIENTAVVNWTNPGTYNMSITPSNMCGEGNMLSQDIYVSSVPTQPAEISGNTDVCVGTESYGVPANSTVDFNWTLSSGGILDFTDNNASVNWNASGIHTLTLTAENRCGAGVPRSLNVTVDDVPSQVGTVSGDRSVCTGTEEYGVIQESGIGYDWTLSGGGMLTENGNTAEVYWLTPGIFTLGITPSNQCGTGSIKNISVSVIDKPSQPSAIIGIDAVCKGIQNYQVSAVSGVNYNWSLSGGGSLIPDDNIAQVDWDTEGNHTLTVVPYNQCGTGASKSLNVAVSAADAQTSGITGNDEVCLNLETYTTDYVGGLDYEWSLLSGGSIVSGSTTNTAEVSWSASGYHTLVLNTSDGCGQSLAVKVDEVPAQPSDITGDNPVCLGESGYFVNHAAGTTYTWTLPSGGSLIPAGNTVTADWTATGTHALTVTPSNHCGDGASKSINVDVRTVPAQPSTITAEDTACLEATTYTIDAVADVAYNWDLANEGGVLIPGTNTADVVWLYPHDNTVSVSLSNLCGTSPLQNKSIVIDDKPELPDILGTTEVCLGEEVYTTALENGHNYLWSIDGGGNLFVENDTAKINWTQTGNHILSLTVSNRCGASETKSIIIKVNDIPAQPDAISGNDEVCYGIEGYDISAVEGVSYDWSLNGGGSISEVNNSVTVNWNTTGTYTLSVTPSNMCGIGAASTKLINVHTVPTQPTIISGNAAVCLDTEVYTVTQTTNTSYHWTLSEGGDLSFLNNTATVDWTDKGIYTLSVTPSNFCGSGISRSTVINVNDIPAKAVFVDAETEDCLGNTDYTINDIPGATYLWSLTSGGTLTNSSTDNTASVEWTQTGMHNLSVTSQNECGNATATTLNLNLHDVPAQPSNITGETSVCLDNEIYGTGSAAGVSYNWSLNGGGNITPNANSVFVSWLNRGTYSLSVTPHNFCGYGTAQKLEIIVNDIPSQPGLISGNANPCINTDEVYTIANVAGTTYGWSVSEGGTITPNGNEASYNWTESGSHTLTVTPENMCGIGQSRSLSIEVKDLPQPIYFSEGESEACLGAAVYAVNSEAGTTYDWQLPEGGILTANQNTSEIEWQQTGTHSLSVTPENICGQGGSASLDITVGDVPAQATGIVGEDTVCLGPEVYSTEVVSDVTYLWSLNGGGTLSPNGNTVLTEWDNKGSFSLSVTPQNQCGNGESQTLTVKVNDIPSQAGLISGKANPCINTDEIYSITDVAGTTYNWSVSEGGTITPNSNEANYGWTESGSHILTVTPENLCGTGQSRSITVSVKDLPQQTYFTQYETETCIGNAFYAVNSEVGTTYDWQLSGGGTLGTNLNTANADWTETGTYSISVTPSNSCGESTPVLLNVEVSDKPAQPANLTGDTSACTGTLPYAVEFQTDADYLWSLSGGGVLNTFGNSALLTWQTPGDYLLRIAAYNACGSSDWLEQNIEVKDLPREVVSITGETEACGGVNLAYTASSDANYDYVWTLTGGGLLNANNETANVNWEDEGVFNLSAVPENRCGQGQSAYFTVTVSGSKPEIADKITGNDTVCYNSSEYYAVDEQAGLVYHWGLSSGGEMNQTNGSSVINWEEAGTHALNVFAENHCGNSDTLQLLVLVETEPEIPVISLLNDTLFSSSSRNNQWYYNGLPIENAVEQFYLPYREGEFTLKTSNSCSESDFAKSIFITDRTYQPYGIKVYPVPLYKDDLTVAFPANLNWERIDIADSYGNICGRLDYNGSQTAVLPFNNLAKGLYLLRVKTEQGEVVFKVMKM